MINTGPHCTVRPRALAVAFTMALTLDPLKYLQSLCTISTLRLLDGLAQSPSEAVTVCGTLGGGCLKQSLPFHWYTMRWSILLRFGWCFEPSFKNFKPYLAGFLWFTVWLLWTATGDIIGLFQSSSCSSGQNITQTGRVCVEVLLICALHWNLFAVRAFYWVSKLLVTALPCCSLTAWMASCMDLCHFREGWVQSSCCHVARFWWWWSWSFPTAWFTVHIIIWYFTLGGCVGAEIRSVIVTRKYFTLGGCCGPGMRTAIAGLLLVGFSSHLVWSFPRCVSITMNHIFAGTGTFSNFREYFSLRGCTGPESYNIFVYCTTVIVIREYFTLGECISVGMSNAICGGVVTPLSLELAQRHCWEVLFRLMALSRAHHWQITSEVLI